MKIKFNLYLLVIAIFIPLISTAQSKPIVITCPKPNTIKVTNCSGQAPCDYKATTKVGSHTLTWKGEGRDAIKWATKIRIETLIGHDRAKNVLLTCKYKNEDYGYIGKVHLVANDYFKQPKNIKITKDISKFILKNADWK